ncbi:MAG: hypothetical protein JWN73_3037 [Betaproteobacteria bacterium]|nr:hypothetical protein [Betaproteobacteria bacterium]
MIRWIAQLFGRASSSDAPATVSPAATAAAAPLVAPAPAHDDEVRALFYRALAGPGQQEAPPATEKLILDELARLIESPAAGADLVPRVPAVIPQLLRSLRDDSVSGAELSRQLAQDVVLVAEVIREANSPYYRPAKPVRTIEGAVMLLGQNGMRMLLARVAFRPIINTQSGPFAQQVAPQVWRQSESCALAASMLAPAMGANPFEAYLAGLLHNVGLIVAFRLVDKIYSGPGLPQAEEFSADLLHLARRLSARIAAQWEFPVTVSGAIGSAGAVDGPPLARVLALADRIASLRLLVDTGRLAPDDPFVLHGLEPAAIACFDKLRYEED